MNENATSSTALHDVVSIHTAVSGAQNLANNYIIVSDDAWNELQRRGNEFPEVMQAAPMRCGISPAIPQWSVFSSPL